MDTPIKELCKFEIYLMSVADEIVEVKCIEKTEKAYQLKYYMEPMKYKWFLIKDFDHSKVIEHLKNR